MPPYRTHHAADLTTGAIGAHVSVAGWLDAVRDHGGLLFLDVRDSSGTVQVVIPRDDQALQSACRLIGRESVVQVTGDVSARPPGTANSSSSSGEVEIEAVEIVVLGPASRMLPFDLRAAAPVREDVRLKYRFLDMRSARLQRNLKLRSDILQFVRSSLIGQGFTEVQTPILTSSSPEGARDYLVPSRRYPGHFYALPQAPQQFKQLLMVGGIERYFQIAPCFRDEDGRADRSPGEFYQIDLEMAFAEQEDVFAVVERLLDRLFAEFSDKKRTPPPYPRLPFEQAMLRYGTDKPDLRNPLIIFDPETLFEATGFEPFIDASVRAIRIPGGAKKSRRFFDRLAETAKERGAATFSWLKFESVDAPSGPLAKVLTPELTVTLTTLAGLADGDAVVFIADRAKHNAERAAGVIRTEIGNQLNLLESDVFRFCWVVDFPMYEWDAEKLAWGFSHNPFSMPQGGIDALRTDDPGAVLAFQYDIVCNGYELSSGAVRNHDPATMVAAFELAGYTEGDIEEQFSSLFTAFQYGAPPHAGVAPGLDRIIMLLADETLIRDVIAFPMTVTARDLLMNAPAPATQRQLEELHISVTVPPGQKKPSEVTPAPSVDVVPET